MLPCDNVTHCRFFFFSSRRRHTRCLSDWSSDVCSSDLENHLLAVRGEEQVGEVLTTQTGGEGADQPPRARLPQLDFMLGAGHEPVVIGREDRSEERRVGKECSSRGWRDQDRREVIKPEQ